MNLSLAVLCWIAISTILGVFFGYSSLELTTSTSLVALSLGLILAGDPRCSFNEAKHDSQIPIAAKLSPCVIAIFFLVFAVREFGQVIFVANDEIRVISPNNLGDICLHLTQINYLASSPHFWPDNPIFAFDKLRYPIGLNVFNAELKLVGIEPKLGIILVGLVGSLITLRALFLFNGSFGVAAFLFNGGLAGFLFFQTYALKDYQADVAWKSIPLAMFVTQRGLLYAVPAGFCCCIIGEPRCWTDAGNKGCPLGPNGCSTARCPCFICTRFSFCLSFYSGGSCFGDPNWRSHFLRLVLSLCYSRPLSFIYVVTGFAKSWSDRLEAGLDGRPERGALVVLAQEFRPVSASFSRASDLSPDSCQTPGPRRQAKASIVVLSRHSRLSCLFGYQIRSLGMGQHQALFLGLSGYDVLSLGGILGQVAPFPARPGSSSGCFFPALSVWSAEFVPIPKVMGLAVPANGNRWRRRPVRSRPAPCSRPTQPTIIRYWSTGIVWSWGFPAISGVMGSTISQSKSSLRR